MFNTDKSTSETDVTYTATLSRAALVAVTVDAVEYFTRWGLCRATRCRSRLFGGMIQRAGSGRRLGRRTVRESLA
jgi:hypothetical protein